MSSGVSLVHQIGALLLLALGSLAIAFLPLSLLHVVYRKKRRRLREEELQLQRSRQQQQQQKIATLSSSAPSTSAGVHHHPELGITPNKADNEKRQQKKAPNNSGGGGSDGRSRRRSFIANWFGLDAASLAIGDPHSLAASRTLSSRSRSSGSFAGANGNGSGGSLYQHFSEVALASTLAIPSIILELIRSLDGGLLLAALFLILLPQLRTSFDTFMSVHVNGGGVKLTGTKPFQTLPLTANETAGEANLTSGAASILISQAAAMRQAAEAEAAVQSAHFIATKSVSPVPLVELILCLAFFALHFIEEFAQLCLRYRKYFWACNSSLVYSSSSGTCESFSSLDYRLSRTKRFLIDCSRKTSSSTLTTTTANTSARTSPQTISNNDDVSRTAALSQQLKIQFSVVTEKDDESGGGNRIATENQQQQRQQQMQTEVKKVSETSAEEDEELDTVCENHGLQDSLQLYGHLGHSQQHQNHNQADFEPNSFLTNESSSSYLPSYYWPPVQTSEHPNRRQSGRGAGASADREFYIHPESGQDSMPYEGDETHQNHQQQQYYPCPCHHQHPPVHPFVYHQQRHPPSDDGTATTSSSRSSSSSSSSSSGVFTKIFLPYTTLATSTPALYFCEGILIAIQPSAAMLWLMLAVILVHKLVTGLLVSFELHEKTTGRQRQLPSSTAVLFTVLPLVGYLTVLFLNGLFLLRAKDRVQASSVVVTSTGGIGDHGTLPSSSSSPTSSSDSSGSASSAGTTSTTTTTTTTLEHTPMEVTAIRVLLFAVASAALLHLVLLIIQRNLATFQPQLQFRKGAAAATACPSPPPVHHHHQHQPTSQVHQHRTSPSATHETDREKRSSTLKTSTSTTTTTSTAAKLPSSSSSSSSSNIPLTNTQPPPPPPPHQRATTLAQVPMCAMTSACPNPHYQISQSPNGPYYHHHRHSQQPQQSVSLDPEIVTNPPRYGVLHHFTMYTGFIIVLMAIAFLNMNSLKV